jgi:hypothetical protein
MSMTTTVAHRVARVLTVATLLGLMWTPAGARARQASSGANLALTPDQMEAFLVNARIVRTRAAGEGVTGTQRVTLSDGKLTHDAQVQTINVSKASFKAPGYSELDFRDCYCYNIAAYRLARLLGLDNVPMSVARRVNGKPAAVTWWIDDVVMDEGDRQKKELTDPEPMRGGHYVYRQRVFDELIQNRDRNLGNLQYTSDWKMWMIDHTRAFRLGRELMKPELLLRIDRILFENLKKLTPAALAAAAGSSLNKPEMAALMARRDAIVKHFEARMAQYGEAAALYTFPN